MTPAGWGNASARVNVARAKVNLTLEVRGKRPDGYHELESLVLFADFGDVLTCRADVPGFSLEVDGPFAAGCSACGAANTIAVAAEAYAQLTGAPVAAAFRLTKNIPVAAGLGGGSADAGAALRLLATGACGALALKHASEAGQSEGLAPPRPCAADLEMVPDLAALMPLARQVGADVPVCLMSRAAVMTGVGERLHPLPPVTPIPAVLVNPMVPLATRDVFRALGAEPLRAEPPAPSFPASGSAADMLAYAAARANDLEAPARHLLPSIGEMLTLLAQAPGAAIARLSGSGPTCFALFHEPHQATAAAAAIARAHPGWWVKATSLS